MQRLLACVTHWTVHVPLKRCVSCPAIPENRLFAVCSEQQVLDLREDDCIYGAAIDIGTTTVAAALVELSTGETVAEDGFVNPQKALSMVWQREWKRLESSMRRKNTLFRSC